MGLYWGWVLLLSILGFIPGLKLELREAWAQEGRFVQGSFVSVTRESPIFLVPRREGKIIADVDPGTILIVVSVSPKQNWIQVEDEGGSRGWIPRRNTDFRPGEDLRYNPTLKAMPEPAPKPAIEESMERFKNPERSLWWAGVSSEWNSLWAHGVQFGFGVYDRSDSDQSVGSVQSKQRLAHTSFSTGVLWAPQGSTSAVEESQSQNQAQTQANTWMVPFRMHLHSWTPGSRWVSGAGLGLLWVYGVDQPWSFNLAYSWGVRVSESVQFDVRPAVNFGRKRYFSAEVLLKVVL